MDPYLEHPARWQGLHNTLISALQLSLAPKLRPRYLVRVERRTFLDEPGEAIFVGLPDLAVHGPPTAHVRASDAAETGPRAGAVSVQIPMPLEVREAYLEIREAPTGHVVTVVELLSPSNKIPGEGRDLYGRKRRTVLASLTNLVEVDLVRIGEPPPFRGNAGESDYRILVSRSERRPRADLWAFGLRDPIPAFDLPLRGGDAEPTVNVREIIDQVYDGAAYDLEIDYRTDPFPPLAEAHRAWADALLRAASLRP